MNIFFKNKSNFDLGSSKNKLNEWINMNYGNWGGELQYYFVKKKYSLHLI